MKTPNIHKPKKQEKKSNELVNIAVYDIVLIYLHNVTLNSIVLHYIGFYLIKIFSVLQRISY